MSKLFKDLTNEAVHQQESVEKQKNRSKNDQTDVSTSHTDVTNRRLLQGLDANKLKTVIKELSEIRVSTHGIPVRLSKTEKRDIEDFIYITLRQEGIEGKAVGVSRLMRYALRYMMKVHKEEFIDALAEGLKKDDKLSI